jgi:hypothetical protein
MSWSNWKTEDIGIKVAGAPAVSSWQEGRLDVFVRTPERRLFHRLFANETWQGTGWQDLSDGHVFDVSPAAVSWGPGRIDLFAVWDKQVHHRAFQGGAWSPWTENLEGTTNEAPAAASWKVERVDVLVRTNDNLMSRRVWESGVTHDMGQGWSNWENIGEQSQTLMSAPAAVATGPSRVDVFGRGATGTLIHTWYQGTLKKAWVGIDNLAIKDAPAAVSGNTADRGRVDLFVRGADDLLKHRIYYAVPQPGTQMTYTVAPGDYLSRIARKFHMPLQALKDLNPQIKPPRYIIHPGDQVVISRTSPPPGDGNWDPGSGWEDISTNKIASAPAAVGWWSSNILRRIDCFAQDANNNLIHTWWK